MPNAYVNMSDEQLRDEISRLEAEADELRARDLKLDMARGKPNPEQVDISRALLDELTSVSSFDDEGVDAANYGCPDGLPSARRLAAEVLGVDPANVIVGNSASLSLMHALVTNAYVHGVAGCEPWCRQGEVKFLCPSPGYDRHFAITESLGIVNVPIEMGADGPDMDEVRRLVEGDPQVKGIWCVPKYENPTGITYSDDVVRAFAALRPAAKDFRIFWDNAYAVHDIVQPGDELLEIFSAVHEAGNSNLVYEFASTSKVTFPGAGMAWVAADDDDLLRLVDRCIVIVAIGFHQVIACQVLIGGENAVGIFTRDTHEHRKTGTGTDEDGFKAFLFHQLVNGNRLSDNNVALDLNAKLANIVDLFLYNLILRKTKLRNTIC